MYSTVQDDSVFASLPPPPLHIYKWVKFLVRGWRRGSSHGKMSFCPRTIHPLLGCRDCRGWRPVILEAVQVSKAWLNPGGPQGHPGQLKFLRPAVVIFHCPSAVKVRDISFKDSSSNGLIVQGTHRSRIPRPMDSLSKGRIVKKLSFGLHRSGTHRHELAHIIVNVIKCHLNPVLHQPWVHNCIYTKMPIIKTLKIKITSVRFIFDSYMYSYNMH